MSYYKARDRDRARGEEAEQELDAHRLEQRQKQLDFGRNTLGYQAYVKTVPKTRRRKFLDPETPDIHQACSKRAWDGIIRVS